MKTVQKNKHRIIGAYFREIKSLVVDIFYSDGWAHGGRNKDTLNVLTLDRSWFH